MGFPKFMDCHLFLHMFFCNPTADILHSHCKFAKTFLLPAAAHKKLGYGIVFSNGSAKTALT
jgi:hypothetical protein